ncbi:MAG: glycosyltransferase, partial [Salinibacterium sp.]
SDLPDIEDYAGHRGLYFEPSEWPGPVVTTVEDLAAEIAKLAAGTQDHSIAKNYASMRQRFSAHEDGAATSRVIDVVFRKKPGGQIVYGTTKTARRTVLINAGRFAPNGISSSLLNLLDQIDHSLFDVSIIFTSRRTALILNNQRQVHPSVRQFARVGGMNGSKFAHLLRRFTEARADLRSHASNPTLRQLWDDEWTRLFGSTTFDFCIDFSGYGGLWAVLMLHAPGATRSIWMHNDMVADSNREVNGKRPQRRTLRGIFTLYQEYDHLVSVSPALARVNAQALSKYAPAEKFESSDNLVSVRRVRENAAVPLDIATTDEVTGERPDWAEDLLNRRAPKTFMTVGRISPEKNHERLIRAFALVHRDDPNTRLVIVGTGPLLGYLQDLVVELDLAGAVWLTGHQVNPHAVMAAADCFVMSSNYEGQPMVIFEAMLVGLPVLTVDFGSVSDALPEGTGLIVEATVDALAAGMRRVLAGDIPAPGFDGDAHNAQAVEQFYRAIGADSAN